jgi:hypothetical protein
VGTRQSLTSESWQPVAFKVAKGESDTAGPSPPSGFPVSLSGVGKARAAFIKAAYVFVDECRVVGNPESGPTARRGRRDDKFRVATSLKRWLVGCEDAPNWLFWQPVNPAPYKDKSSPQPARAGCNSLPF